nr:E3 SUMO-protein ligase ZBED1-like [Nothobranchius furzeri]
MTILERFMIYTSDVEGVRFKKMIKTLDLRYEFCSRNRTSEPYLSLTIHYMSNWELHSATLQTTYFPEDHTGEHIAAGLREALETWGLKEENMTCMTTDSGSNMVKALDLNGWTRLPCFGHRLHLAIENGSRDPPIERATSVCKKVVSTFSLSWKKKRALTNAQASMNLPQQKLKTESPTRWGSRLAMIERILQQEKAISHVLKSDKKTKHVAPTWQDLDVVDSIKKALGPLRDFTDALSGEDYVSASYVKPVLYLLHNNLLKPEDDDTELTAQIKTSIVNYLTEKYQDPVTDALLDMASLVDHRFKTQYIHTTKKEQRLSRAVAELESLLTPESEHPVPSTSSTSQSQSPEAQPAKKARKSLACFFKTAAVPSTSTEEPTLRELIEKELQAYLSTPNVDSEMNPLEWWKAHEVFFPKVSQLAQKYLCIPATSSPSERVFSTGGNIVTCQRAALKPDKVDKLIFLAKNL